MGARSIKMPDVGEGVAEAEIVTTVLPSTACVEEFFAVTVTLCEPADVVGAV